MHGETGEVEEYLLIGDMQKQFPMFCSSECLAWCKFNKRCNKVVMAEPYCGWSVNKLTDRISRLSRLNGPKWWVKKHTEIQTTER